MTLVNNPTPSAPAIDEVSNEPLKNQDQSIPIVQAVVIGANEDATTPNTVEQGYAPETQSNPTDTVPTSRPDPTKSSTVEVNPEIGRLGRNPKEFTCPYCNHRGKTRIQNEISFFTLLWIFVWGFMFFPLAFLGCCCTKFQDSVHRCTKCNRIVGVTRAFSDCC